MRIFFRIFVALFYMIIIFPSLAYAAENMKLPYAAGERFIVSTGYDTPPTHIKKDSYAIDFTQNGCDAYGRLAVAAFSGTAWIVEEDGYNGGYGTQLLVLSAGNVVTRYAHMIPGSIPVRSGDVVPQGTVVGEIGDTGLVAGNACADHPGTHIHFAAYMENADGSFSAKDPEPISNYTEITVEHWYLSDNALVATKGNLAALLEVLGDLLGSSASVIGPSSSTVIKTSVSSNIPSQSVDYPPSSSASMPDAPISSSSVPAMDVSQPSSLENAANSITAPPVATNPPVSSLSSSGGSAPASGGGTISGGVSASLGATGGSSLSTSTSNFSGVSSSNFSSPDDPTNDSVTACQ